MFIRNILNNDMVNNVKINERMDGTKQAVVSVDLKKKGRCCRQGRQKC